MFVIGIKGSNEISHTKSESVSRVKVKPFSRPAQRHDKADLFHSKLKEIEIVLMNKPQRTVAQKKTFDNELNKFISLPS
jgi:hypothetical protein